MTIQCHSVSLKVKIENEERWGKSWGALCPEGIVYWIPAIYQQAVTMKRFSSRRNNDLDGIKLAGDL